MDLAAPPALERPILDRPMPVFQTQGRAGQAQALPLMPVDRLPPAAHPMAVDRVEAAAARPMPAVAVDRVEAAAARPMPAVAVDPVGAAAAAATAAAATAAPSRRSATASSRRRSAV